MDEIRSMISDTSRPFSTLPKSKVQIENRPDGQLQLWFGPARNKGAAAFMLLFTLIWTGVVVFLCHSDAPLFMALVFGFFDLILLLILTLLWLGTSRVRIQPGEITLKRGLLGGGKLRAFHNSEVSKIEECIGMQSGHKVFYGIELHLQNGKKLKLGSGIPDKGEVMALIQAIEQSFASR